MVGGTSIMPFAERKFIYKQQGNTVRSTGMAAYMRILIGESDSEKLGYK